MKKLLIMFFALFAMTFFAKAQQIVFTENFDAGMPTDWTQIDVNNDGYGWEHCSNPVSYFAAGANLSGTGHNGSTGFVLSGSYSNVTYEAITPDNWLITPAISLTGAATLSFWVCSQDANYSSEHYGVYISTTTNTDTTSFTLLYEATIGQTRTQTTWENHTINLSAYNGETVYIAFRHFNCTDMFCLNLDDVEVTVLTNDPLINIDQTSLTMSAILGNTASATVQVNGYNLSSTITASTNAPFEVSSDDINYSATASLSQTGGTLYVRYNPTAAGTDNETITLTSGTATASITLTGTAVDCNVTLPYTETFETTSPYLGCWTTSGSGSWTIGTGDYSSNTGAYEGSYNALITHSSTGNTTQLISPVLNGVTDGVSIDFAYVMRSWSGDIDELRVYSRADANSAWQQVAEYTNAAASWTIENVIISGPVYQVAFEHTDRYGYGIGLDNVSFTAMTPDFCYPVANLTVSGVTAHEATLTWSGDANSYTIYDLYDTTAVATVNDTTYTLTTLASDTQHSFAVVANCASGSSNMVAVSFHTLISCPVPTGLAAVLTPGDGTVATLNWTENGTATAWQICLNDDETNLIDVNNNATYDLTGLTPEQAYTAKVRAICDVDDQSAWSATITFTPTNAYVLTVNDGTSTNGFVPIYGYYADEFTRSQFIIPASDLSAMQFDTINKMTFYASNASVSWGAATFEVYVTETNETTLSDLADYTTMTQVYAGSLSIVNNTMEVNFTTPYQYLGGNLMIGFLQTVEGSWSSCSWYGVSATGASIGGYNTSLYQQNFLPKTTFAFTPGDAPACLPINNLTVSNITAHEATLEWQGEASSYIIYDLSDTSVVATVNNTTHTLTGLASDSQHEFGVVASCGSDVSIMRTISFTTLISCPVPTDLAVVLTPGNGTIATLNWHENGTATEWQICLNGDETNLIPVTDTTYDFTGLTPEQAYTAKVRAVCSTDDHSAWSSTFTFTPTNAYTITVNDGTTTNSYVPIYGLYVDELTHSQFIIPAADLTNILYGTINKLTFYASQTNVNWGAASFNVYMTETSDSTLSALQDYTTMTQVYAGSLSIVNNTMEVTFTNPYLYMGGNLMIGFDQTVQGTYISSYWYGVSATGASMGGYNNSVSQQNFLPKTCIAYTPGTAPSCLPVEGLTVDAVTSNSVTLSWTGTAASYDVYNGTSLVGNTTNTTYTITGLASASEYTFGVQAVCSATDIAIMRTINASTECGAIEVYPYVQDFSSTPLCWTVIDADGDGNNWYIYQGTIQSASYSGTALHPDNWLISPEFAIPSTGNYEVTWSATAQDQSWPAEHYGVFISTTGNNDTANFTMIQEWTLATGIFNPVIDLSSYAGQNIYIALRHFNCTDQFRLSIDDFTVREQAGANQVVINAGPNNPAYGTVTGSGIYTIGDNVTVTATAASSYTFSKWVDENSNILSTDNPYTFVAATNLDLTAVFLNASGTTYTITVQVNDSTMGTATGGGTYTAGDQITLVATPNAGYNFVNWTQESSFGTNVVSTDPSFTITVTSDKTFIANFEAGSTPTQYTVTLSSANSTMGSVSPEGASTVNAGETFTATATAFAGYHFEAWVNATGTPVSTVNPYTFTVTEDVTLYARFEVNNPDINYYNVNVTSANTYMGNVTSTASGSVAENTEVTVTATALAGYRFVNWTDGTGTVISTENPYTFTVTANVTLIANFETEGGVDAITLAQSISLMPNPAVNYIELRVNSNVTVKEAVVYNAFGQMIQTVQLNDNHARIDLSNVAAGMYFIRVNGDNVRATKKFIKR